jgi:hypothetical protein
MIISKSDLEKIFDMAILNITKPDILGSYTAGKAFELYALVKMLERLKRFGYQIKKNNPIGLKANELKFAGGPSKADKSKYSFCSIYLKEDLKFEAWISVEIETLSAKNALGASSSAFPASYHELDLAVFMPLKTISYRPSIDELTFAASCKYTTFKKENLREALGLRRETAYLTEQNQSLADWFIKEVPAHPAVPLVLFSRDVACNKYQKPVDAFGVYVQQLKFP